jgi:hypothetical protein
MERREFLKLTLGFTAAAGAIAAGATVAQAAPMLSASDMPPKVAEAAMRSRSATMEKVAQGDLNAIDDDDVDMSARRWWRRRRRVIFVRRRPRRWRRRRVIYY